MKIAFFSDCYLDFTGGIVTLINAQKKALEARGHTVYIFTTAYPRSKTTINKFKKQNIFIVPSCKLFFWKLSPISRRPKVIEKWLLKKHPEIKDFNIFYSHYEAGCSIAGIRLAKKLKKPAVQMMHGREDIGETNIIPFGLRTFVAWGLNWLHSWYLPHPIKIKRDDYLATSLAKAKMWSIMVNHANSADLVIVPSKQFAKKLKHYGVTKKLTVVPNGVSDEWFPLDTKSRELKPNEPLKIIWHSRVSAEKRIMPFLKALSTIPSGWTLDVFGGGGDAFRARRFARRRKLKVKFHGNTSFKTLHEKLLEADLDVLASYNFDTFGMTLIEAEAAGVPVLICDPDLSEVVPENGRILTSDPSPSAIATSIKDLIDNPEKINNLSKAMLANRSEVLISNRIKILESLFESLINNK